MKTLLRGVNKYCWDMDKISTGGYIIIGYIKSLGSGNNDLYLVKADDMRGITK